MGRDRSSGDRDREHPKLINMRIVSNFEPKTKPLLPTGKLTAKWVYSRGKYQVYLGGKFLSGVSGDSEEDCYEELLYLYDAEGREIDFKD